MHEFSGHLASLYLSERNRLQKQIARIVGCPVTAADLVHDIFLRLWDRTVNWTGDPAAYLTRSARNAAIDHLRSERTRAEFVADVIGTPRQTSVPSPHEALEARDSLSQVDAAIRALPSTTRHVFLLSRVHGCSYREIGDAFNLSIRAVDRHMTRALKAIRKAVERD